MNNGYVNDLLMAVGDLQSFRGVAHRIGGFLAVKYIEKHSYNNNAVLLPVLRAGSALERSFLKRIFPAPRLHYIDTKRDPETLKPKIWYKTFGLNESEADVVIILEPMLATGGTMLTVINEINDCFKPKQIVIISAFVSKKAEELLKEKVEILVLSKNHDLDEKGYILIPNPYNPENVSTLDFGDEYCGTYSH